MGTLSILANHPSRAQAEVYAPVNYRPADSCRLFVFPEDGREGRLYSYQAVQYCVSEVARRGFHILELPTGERGMFWLTVLEDGRLDVRDYHGAEVFALYPPGAVRILGRVFQWIPDLNGEERIELIRGPAIVSREDATRPLINIVRSLWPYATGAGPLIYQALDLAT